MCVNVCVCVVGCVCVRACTWLRVRQQCLRVATQHAGARKEQCCVCVYMFACARKVIVQTPDLGIHFVRCCVCACVLRRPVSVCHCVYMLMPRHCLCCWAKRALCVCVREGGGCVCLRRPVSVCHCVYMLMPRHCLCRSAKHALCVCVREGGGEGGGKQDRLEAFADWLRKCQGE